MSSPQASLRLEQPRAAQFDNFWPGGNGAALQALREFCTGADDGQYLLIGPAASGKSHLLQAACRSRWAAQRDALYLQPARQSLAAVERPAQLGQVLLAIDALEQLPAGDDLALLRLIDSVRAAGGQLLLASRQWPERLVAQCPDLRSRLSWGVVLELKPLDEAALAQWLAQQARDRGIRLPTAVIDYLLRRLPRDPGSLMSALDQAYAEAVVQRRQITVPLLRELLQP